MEGNGLYGEEVKLFLLLNPEFTNLYVLQALIVSKTHLDVRSTEENESTFFQMLFNMFALHFFMYTTFKTCS